MASLTSQLILTSGRPVVGPAGRMGGALTKTSSDVRRFGQSVRGQDGGLDRLKNSLTGAAAAAERKGSAQRRLRADTDAATAAFQRQLNATRAASYAALNGRGAGAGAMVAGAGALGARGLAMAGGAYGVARTVTTSISSYAELDRTMRRVGLTSDATGAGRGRDGARKGAGHGRCVASWRRGEGARSARGLRPEPAGIR